MEKLKNGKNNGLQSFNPSTPQLFKDSAIREMLRRRHAAVPPLSDGFEEKLFAAYERQHKMRRLIIWPSIATAATVALLLTLHFAKQPVSTTQLAKTQPPSVNIIVSPKEPSAPTHILSEASSKEKPKTHKRETRVTTQKGVTDNSTATAVEENTEEQHLANTSNDKQESIEKTKASDAKPNKEVEPALFNHNRYKVRSHIAAAFNILQSTSEI